jgi:DNA-binding IclR family transcriptional regulator
MENTRSASTTSRVLAVLQALADANGPVGTADLAAATGLDRGEVHRILQELLGAGFASTEPGTGLFRTGPAALGLGNQARRRDALRDAAMPVVARLAALTGETATLSARQGYERCYVGQVESMQPIRISVTLGERIPLVSGANGLAILAFLPEADVEQVLRLPRPRWTATTVTDVAAIRERLAVVREQGWARTDGERVRHSASVAAPVLAPDGVPAGSLSVAYLAERADEEAIAALPEVVLAAAAEATERLCDAVA